MSHEKPASRRLWRTLRELILVAGSIALIYVVLAPRDQNPFHPVALVELRGVWTCNDARYRDRFLQFDDRTVTFGWGEAGSGSFTVDQIESEPEASTALVRIGYTDLSEAEYQLNFYYSRLGSGSIRMKHQRDLYWYRTSDKPIHTVRFD